MAHDVCNVNPPLDRAKGGDAGDGVSRTPRNWAGCRAPAFSEESLSRAAAAMTRLALALAAPFLLTARPANSWLRLRCIIGVKCQLWL